MTAVDLERVEACGVCSRWWEVGAAPAGSHDAPTFYSLAIYESRSKPPKFWIRCYCTVLGRSSRLMVLSIPLLYKPDFKMISVLIIKMR